MWNEGCGFMDGIRAESVKDKTSPCWTCPERAKPAGPYVMIAGGVKVAKHDYMCCNCRTYQKWLKERKNGGI